MSSTLRRAQPMACDPAYERGLYVYAGDILRRTTPTRETGIVLDVSPEESELHLYNIEQDCIQAVPSRAVWETISLERSWATFWLCLGREVAHVLDGTDFRTFVAQAHVVFTETPTEVGLTPSICFSWSEYAGDRFQSPLDMNWCKYRHPDNLIRDLRDPFSKENFAEIREWVTTSKAAVELLENLARSVDGLRRVRVRDVEYLLNNPEIFS